MTDPTSETPVAVSERFVPLARGRVFLRDWRSASGDAPPILLFHDSLGCVELWRDFPALLAARTGRRVIAYDRIGFGRSDPHAGRPDLDFIGHEGRAVVPRILAATGCGRFVACGHSVGGAMAVNAAAHAGAACEAVVTIGTQAFVEDRTLAGIAAAAPVFRGADMQARLARYHGDKAAWAVDAWVDTWLSPEFAGYSLDAARAALRCPVLAIHGDRDEYGSTEHARRIAGEGGETEIVAGGGHVLHREEPVRLAARIAGFLGR